MGNCGISTFFHLKGPKTNTAVYTNKLGKFVKTKGNIEDKYALFQLHGVSGKRGWYYLEASRAKRRLCSPFIGHVMMCDNDQSKKWEAFRVSYKIDGGKVKVAFQTSGKSD